MFKRFLVPHKHNTYRPHIFRSAGISLIALVLVGLFGYSVFQNILLTQTDFLASIISSTLVDSTNQNRTSQNLGSLTVNPLLTLAAQQKANDMASKGYFAHVSPDGVTPWHWFSNVGYDYVYAGENLAIDFTDSGAVEQAWMNSPTHRANILDGRFTEIGIATAQGMYNGHQTDFVVQMFGTPVEKVVGVPVVKAVVKKPTPVVTPVAIKTPTKTSISTTSEKIPAVKGLSADVSYASPLDHVLANPSTIVQIVLCVLALLVVISLILIIVIEAARRDKKHMIIGLAILIIILVLLYLTRTVFFSGVHL